MAVIRELLHTPGKAIPTQTETVADYNMDDQYFSLWSYKNGDIQRAGNCHQNMQFNKEHARELRDLLNKFLGE